MANKGNPDLTKMIVEDIKKSIDEAQGIVNKMAYFNIPDPYNFKLPLAFVNGKGEVHIRGEKNPHLAFINGTKEGVREHV